MNRRHSVLSINFIRLGVDSCGDMTPGIGFLLVLCVCSLSMELIVALVTGLMTIDVEQRMTLEQAMQHPWVRRYFYLQQ